MLGYYGPMCDLDDSEPLYIIELRSIVEEFDRLMDICWDNRLTPEESMRLNKLHVELNEREESYWDGVSHEIVGLLQGRLDTDFCMIRHMLGMIHVDTPE